MVPSVYVSRSRRSSACGSKIDGVGAFIDPCVIGLYTIVGRAAMLRGAATTHTEFLNLYDVDAQRRGDQGDRSLKKPPGELVRVGAACWLADNVTILEGVQIGNGVDRGCWLVGYDEVDPRLRDRRR